MFVFDFLFELFLSSFFARCAWPPARDVRYWLSFDHRSGVKVFMLSA